MIEGLPTRLKIERVRKNLSQSHVAKAVGVSPSQLSHYENGYTSPPALILGRLAVFYGVTADFLLGLEREKGILTNGLDQEDIEALNALADRIRKAKNT